MSPTGIESVLATTALYLKLAAPWAAASALLLSVFGLLCILSLRKRLTRLALGRNGSIEETISILSRDTKELQIFRVELEKYLKTAELRMRGSIQGIGVVRFNPFSGDGSGGNQSFCAAFLDERHSGVVFSTLYSRDRVGVYAKPVDSGASTYELSKEEQSAIEKAKNAIVQNKRPQ